MDYRAFNKLTVKNKFPISLIGELIEKLVGVIIFSKIDSRAGYHQIRISNGDISKIVFRTHNGHYEFFVISFGLTNVSTTF